MPFRVVWNVVGASAGEDEGTYVWPDDVARLVGGPEEITGQHVQARIEEYEIDEEGNETIIGYPGFSVTSFTLGSTLDINDWQDPTNPVKPPQAGGPITYGYSQLPYAIAGGSYAQCGIIDQYSRPLGFGANFAGINLLADSQPTAADKSMWVALDTGHCHQKQTGPEGNTWRDLGLLKDPAEIITVATLDDFPEAPADGVWAIVTSEGNVYAYTTDRWLNIGPILGAGSSVQVTVVPHDDSKKYISGYIYVRVFDRAEFRYVSRHSPGTQSQYTGDIDVKITGWFPTEPYDEDRNIYPMDSVTSVVPDDREKVTVAYTATIATSLAGGSITIYQDVYPPTSNWANLIEDLLDRCYFTHGIYH